MKTTVIDGDPMLFQIAAISPLGSKVCLRMDDNNWTLIMSGDFIMYDVLAWASVSVTDCFDDYRIESTLEDNTILLEVEIQHLVRAFKSVATAVIAVAKLIPVGDNSYLRFELFDDEELQHCRLRHDVPIEQLGRDFETYEKPNVERPELKLVLNDVRNLRTIVDKLCKIDNIFTIEANAQGNLRVRLDKDGMVKIESRFKCPPDLKAEGEYPNGLSKSVRVRAKALQKLLAGLCNVRAKENSIWLCFVAESTLVVHCLLECVDESSEQQSITYYVNLEVNLKDEQSDDEMLF